MNIDFPNADGSVTDSMAFLSPDLSDQFVAPSMPPSENIPLSMQDIRGLQKITALETQRMNINVEIEDLGNKRLNYEKMFFSVVLLVAACLVIHFLFIYISIRTDFSGVIDYVDGVVAARDNIADQTIKNMYYNYTDGFTIAFYYKFPRLPTNPFLNLAFPASIIFSYYTPQMATCFTSDPENIQEMYVFSVVGDLNQCGTQDETQQSIQQTCAQEPSAHQIICRTYGTELNCQFGDCKSVCRKDISLGTYTFVGQLVGMGATGAFIGGSAAKGMGESMGVGPQIVSSTVFFAIGASMAAVTTSMSKSESTEYTDSFNKGYCAEPKS